MKFTISFAKITRYVGLVEDGDIKNVTPLYINEYLKRLPFMARVVKEYNPTGLGALCITMEVKFITFAGVKDCVKNTLLYILQFSNIHFRTPQIHPRPASTTK